jgi:hypothetical protein
VHAQHRRQWVRRPAAFLAGLGVVGLDQGKQCLSGHHRLHLKEELHPFVLLLSLGALVIREAELHAIHYLSPGLRSQVLCPAKALVFKSLSRLQSLCLARTRMGLVGA